MFTRNFKRSSLNIASDISVLLFLLSSFFKQ